MTDFPVHRPGGQLSSVPLCSLLKRSLDAAELEPTESYKQLTVRLRHQGVVLRGVNSANKLGSSRQYRARSGQLILSRIDARNGAIGLVPDDLDGAIVTNDFWLFDIDCNKALPKYLNHYMGTQQFADQCKSVSEGTTNRVRLQLAQFLALEILLPPIHEQRRIVAHGDALVARAERVRSLLVAVQRKMEFLIVALHIAHSRGRTVALGDILVLDEDREPVVAGSVYPQVGVRGFGQGLFSKDAVHAGQTTYRSFNRLYEGAVVLSQPKGWEGAIAVVSAEFAGKFVSPEYRTFRCIPTMALPTYLSVLVATPWFHGYLTSLTRGVGARRERARPEAFLKLRIPMPTIERQAALLMVLDKLTALKSLQIDGRVTLDTLLPAVLSQVFK